MNVSETRSSAVIWISLLALICFLVWASQAELEQITRAPGQIIASGRTQVIQASDGGVLQALLVKEGDTVERDQVLALLDRQKLHAAYQETRSRELALRATVARLNAEIVGNEPAFPADTEGYPQFRANQLRYCRSAEHRSMKKLHLCASYLSSHSASWR